MALQFGRCSYDLRKFGCKYIWSIVQPVTRLVSTGSNTQQIAVPKSDEDLAVKSSEEERVEVQLPIEKPVEDGESPVPNIPRNYRFRYPEFLPDPRIEWRHALKEKLERKDMLARRTQIQIPAFYVGSILKVTYSNVHQPDKTSEFLGICIERALTGLRSTFLLRNIIDNLGVEMRFALYDPKLIRVEVIRLERRLDDSLLYLRDALPEYSTFPLDMKAEFSTEGEVPLNPVKVILKPRPWYGSWHKCDFKGIANIGELITKKMKIKHKPYLKEYEKYDLMKDYRLTIPEEEQEEIYSEVIGDLAQIEKDNKTKRRRPVSKPKPNA